MILLDANIILRFILANDPELSPKAEIIIKKIEQGKVKIQITLLAFSEVVFTLERAYKMPKAEITQKLLYLLQVNNLKFEKQNMLPEIFKYYHEKNISFIDAYHIVLMNKKKIKNIYSFDRDFDKFPEVKRLEN